MYENIEIVQEGPFDGNKEPFHELIAEAIESVQIAYDSGLTDEAAEELMSVLSVWSRVVAPNFNFTANYMPEFTHNVNRNTATDSLRKLISALNEEDFERLQQNAEALLDIIESILRDIKAAILRKQRTAEDAKLVTVTGHLQLVGQEMLTLAQLRHKKEMRRELKDAQASALAAKKSADDAANAAGMASTSTLSARFTDLAMKETKLSWWFRGGTVLMISIGIIGSYFLHETRTNNLPESVFNIALLAAVLGLATYLGRQAAHHRDLSVWASTITVQLQTFEGYISPVQNAELQSQIRLAFAGRVFGPSPESQGEPSATLASPLLEQVIGAYMKTKAPS